MSEFRDPNLVVIDLTPDEKEKVAHLVNVLKNGIDMSESDAINMLFEMGCNAFVLNLQRHERYLQAAHD